MSRLASDTSLKTADQLTDPQCILPCDEFKDMAQREDEAEEEEKTEGSPAACSSYAVH